MSWLLIAVVFIGLWMVESVFGWLLGGQLREWLLLAALVYFGISIARIKSAQDELQKELNRLWKVVKTTQQTNANTTPNQHQTEPDKAAEFNPATDGQDTLTSKDVWGDLGTPASPPSPQYSYQATESPECEENSELTDNSASSTESRHDAWLNDDYPSVNQEPNFIENWLSGGNWIVRGGLAILFIGLVFLAKFAYENALLPLELRLAAIAGFAIALLIIGWRSQTERPAYGLSLQGGGVATLYLTIFATAKLTTFLPPLLTMILMLFVAILAAWLAILQDALVLAVIGTIGGFMAPVLMSTGQGSHIALFSYFAALDAGILTVALRKAWRPLNVLAFFFTFGIAGLWGIDGYKPEFQFSCLPFLALFFAMFIAVSMLFTRHQTDVGEYARTIDATLLFGVPTITFGYGLYLLRPYEYGGAWLAVAMSAVYLGLAYFAKDQEKLVQLKTPWATLSLLFATFAVPLAFDPRTTSSIWALEGAAVSAYAWRQQQPKTRWFGYLLVLLGTLGFFSHLPEVSDSFPVFNALTIGLLVLALAYSVIGWALNQDNPDDPNQIPDEVLGMSWIMAIALGLVGALAITNELYSRQPASVASIAVPALLWGWALILQKIGAFTHWRQTIAPTIILPLLTLVLPIHHSWIYDGQTTQGVIFTALALAGLLTWQALVLKKILPELKAFFPESGYPATISALPGFALAAFWVTLLVRGSHTWSAALFPESGLTLHGWFLPLATVLPILLLWWLSKQNSAWSPVGNSPAFWRWLHGDQDLPDTAVYKQLRVFATFTILYLLATSLFHSGNNHAITYLPFLNLYELVATGGLLALLRLFRNTPVGETLLGESRIKFWAGLAFLFANSILSRILANFFGAEFFLGFAWRSAIAATTYSIVWSVAALAMMWLASRRMRRGVWIAGAVLLGVVAIKLLLIDLSKVGSLARIVSFIGVGVLMLVVGYVAPIPAEEKSAQP